ncbi:hypothetical protein GR160_06630 [Flavobacterium sp. Sd200]|uniref:hypothetical protein n=1 Tax=Flavobacterium sp. Sd200 TaxID=2692211 RepID=UPI00136AD841|nr:hypothetical protein [Flavobacterium sp. Sd200]MXN90899.1 hypothetical protein [Flavobacterium sp. Sd200]
MKKAIVLSAVVLATTLSFTSCGKKEAEATPETTTTDSTVVETVETPAGDTTTVVTDSTTTTVTDTVKK